MFSLNCHLPSKISAVDSGGAGGARAPPKFGGSEKGRSQISAYRSLAITTNTPGFKKLSTALKISGMANGETYVILIFVHCYVTPSCLIK